MHGYESESEVNTLSILRDQDCLGCVSSIHLLGLFSTTVTMRRPFSPSRFSPSAKRPRSCAGHGRTFEADTVITEAMNVSPKRAETNVRRWRGVKLSALDKDISKKESKFSSIPLARIAG